MAEDVGRLLKDAAASMKRDAKEAVGLLERAYEIVTKAGNPDDVAYVAEELARGWMRRKANARSLHYASKAAELAPAQKSSWTTLAKTCELVASRVEGAHAQSRARALYKAAGAAFEKAASMTKDPEDKRWLLELAGDAARQAKPPA